MRVQFEAQRLQQSSLQRGEEILSEFRGKGDVSIVWDILISVVSIDVPIVGRPSHLFRLRRQVAVAQSAVT
jgi:hypothetical protein